MSRELKFNYCHGNADLPWRANGPSAIIMSDQPRTRDRESPPDRYRDYANDVLVSPEWLSRRLDDVRSDDPSLRLVEVDVDPDFYDHEHVPGAIGFDWNSQLRHRTRHDIPSPEAFEELLGSHGIGDDSTVVVYGDNSNWFAAHFYWQLTYYGHRDVYLLDGGREHWLESGRETTPEVPEFTPTTFTTSGPYEHVRARREEVRRAIDDGTVLLDVRMVEEYDGTIVSHQASPRPPAAVATSRGLSTSSGRRTSVRTAGSNPGKNWRRSTATTASPARTPSSLIVGSANVLRCRGSSSRNCSATSR